MTFRFPPMSTLPLGLAALIAAVPVQAATFTVDVTTDAADALPGDGTCAAAGGGCSVRAAIQEANETPGEDTVVIPAGTHTLTIGGVGENDGATGDLDVADPVVIEGAGAASTVLDGGGIDRVLDLGADTTIRRLTIRGGDADAENGGGVRATPLPPHESMTVTIEDTVVTGNDALGGGGIANELLSTLVLRRSTLTNNYANGGGGLDEAGDGSTLENVTVSGNFALNGDGIRSAGSVALTHATVVDDMLSGDGFTLEATLLDNGAGSSCGGTVTIVSAGGNLERGTGCGLSGTGDQSGVDPMVLDLGDYGGETPTHAILAGSPAVDVLAACALAEDQRGITRPQDGDSSGDAACDVGAFETEPGFMPTTTTTTTGSTTTTTLPDCTVEPTLGSTTCRVQSLAIRFAGASEAVKLAARMSKLLAKAGDRLPVAQDAIDQGKVKKAKKQVAKAGKLVRKFGRKLGGKKGPKIVVDEGARATLVADATSLEADLFLLRDSIQ